jgi:hypothetical protein
MPERKPLAIPFITLVQGAISHFFMAFKFHIIFPYVLLHEKVPFNSTMFGEQIFNINTQITLLQKLTIYETCNPSVPELNAQCDAEETRM